jgi:hypothetical protein
MLKNISDICRKKGIWCDTLQKEATYMLFVTIECSSLNFFLNPGRHESNLALEVGST